MPIKNGSEHVDMYAICGGKWRKLDDISKVVIDTDSMDDSELRTLRSKSALTVTVSIDDESWLRLNRIVQRGIKRRKKWLSWKRNRRYMRRHR